MAQRVESLRAQISALERVLEGLRDKVSNLEKDQASQPQTPPPAVLAQEDEPRANGPVTWKCSEAFSGEEYKRYGRQMILPEIGLKGR